MDARILIFMSLIASGFLVQVVSRLLRFEELFRRVIHIASNLVYYVLIPLAFVKTYAERLVSICDLCIAMSVVALVIATYISMKIVVRGADERLWNSLFITSCFPNAIFIGFPISLLFFGTIAVASTYGLVMLVLNILVPDLLAMKKIMWRKLFTLPALLGFLVGVSTRLVMGDKVSIITNVLSWSPLTLSYTATFLLGSRLPLKASMIQNKRNFLLISAFYRFLFAPFISLAVALIMRSDSEMLKQLLLISSMPPAVMNTLIAHKYGWFDELVAYSTVILTLTSLAFYTALLLIF